MLQTELQKIADQYNLTLSTKRGRTVLERVVAERKAFLSKKKLRYHASIAIDEQAKTLRFSERLTESGSGLSGGMGSDGDMGTAGFGFKKTSYRVGMGGRTESIQEQSTLFGKTYDYQFDLGPVRKAIEQLARTAGLTFEYHIGG